MARDKAVDSINRKYIDDDLSVDVLCALEIVFAGVRSVHTFDGSERDRLDSCIVSVYSIELSEKQTSALNILLQ